MKRLLDGMKRFWNNEQGIGTLEIILIIAVIVVIAVLFKSTIMGWVNKILNGTSKEIDKFDPSSP